MRSVAAFFSADCSSSPSLELESRLRFLFSRPSGPGTLVSLTCRDLTSFSFFAARFPYAGRQSMTVPYAGGSAPFAGVCLLTLKAKSLELTIAGQQTGRWMRGEREIGGALLVTLVTEA